MKIKGKMIVEAEVDGEQLASAIMEVVLQKYGDIDDAGCDWGTDNGQVFIGSHEWLYSKSSQAAALVDAANILHYGRRLIIDDAGDVGFEEGIK